VRRIALNRCMQQLRSAWVVKRADVDVVELLAARSDRHAVESESELGRALDRLSDTARAVVWLYDVEGSTHAEIANLMGRTPSFSKSQLARAHGRLREILSNEFVEEWAEPCRTINTLS